MMPFVPKFQCPECSHGTYFEAIIGFTDNHEPIFQDGVSCTRTSCTWSGPRTACGLAPPPATCPKCRHKSHPPGGCLNAASDNECNCDYGLEPPAKTEPVREASEDEPQPKKANTPTVKNLARVISALMAEIDRLHSAGEELKRILAEGKTKNDQLTMKDLCLKSALDSWELQDSERRAGIQESQSSAAERERQVGELVKAAKYLHRVTEAVARYGRPSEGGESVGNTATIIDGRHQVADALAALTPTAPSGHNREDR